MKKILSIFLAIILIIGMIAGCSSEGEVDTPTTEPIIIETQESTEYVETPKETAPIVEEAEETEPIVEEIESVVEDTEPPAPIITYVYSTPQGSKYHKITCHHIEDKETTEWTIEDAQAAGLEACKTCKPR